MNSNIIFQKVTEIYRECAIKTFPINTLEILKHYGFQIYTYTELLAINERLYDISSCFTNDAFQYDKTIAYNENANSNRIQFTLMHELGHYILNTDSEDEADYFASYILAPRILIHKFNCWTADQIHDKFGLSYAAANRALADYNTQYRKLSWTTLRNPTESELQLAELFFPPEPISVQTEFSDSQATKANTFGPKEKPTLSAEAEARKLRVLSKLRKERKKREKKYREYQEDMKFLEFTEDETMARIEYQQLYGNDL